MNDKELAQSWIRKSRRYSVLSFMLALICISVGGIATLLAIISPELNIRAYSEGIFLMLLAFVWVEMWRQWKLKEREWHAELIK